MLKTNQLVKVFKTDEIETTALNKVDLEVQKGEFVAIMGPSGCGKSTLLNIIGLLDNPTSGELYFDGTEVSRFKEKQRTELRKANVGFVFQSFNLIDELTVFENVELPLMYRGIGKEERHERAMEALRMVGLEDRVKHSPTELSGGQQQRVAVARALASRPQFILADEPTANLDSASTENLLDIMAKMNEEENATFVFSTHDQRVIDKAKRVITLEDGTIISDETR